MTDPSRIPVIAGIGEVIDRENSKEPRALIVEAARAAGAEAPGLLQRVDSLDVVSIVSWRYADIAGVVAAELGATPRRAGESSPGGEKPIRLLGEAAQRIAEGQSEVALICGGEATRTRAKSVQAGQALDWGPTDADAKPITGLDFVTPHAARYGLIRPPQIYPLYENVTRHVWGQTQAEADRESATLWSRYSEAAAANPYAWLGRVYAPEEIESEANGNRLIAFPYRKLMVANPMVNQGAAILVTSLAAARAAGIDESQLVYIWGGARANEPADFLARDSYERSAAQDAVLATTLAQNEVSADEIDLLEFYSCFPTVPKMARRTLGLGEDFRPSVTGGLTFFGGPANDFMTHAVAAAVRAIRARQGRTALLYGQGEFVTKHAAVLLGDRPYPRSVTMTDVQPAADAAMAPAPALLEDYDGPCVIESFTIVYDREGQPIHAPVVARTPAGERVVAQVKGEDEAVIGFVSDPGRDPIGAAGRIAPGTDGLLHFTLS